MLIQLKKDFRKLAEPLHRLQEAGMDVFTEADWAPLPPPVRRYFATAGFTGQPKMASMQAVFRNVPFILAPKKNVLRIDYTQVNSVRQPDRVALIDSRLYGIPFQGLDTYLDGRGSMRGVFGKLFTVLNEQGKALDQACLVTFLSETMLLPAAALQSYITWEPVDDLHAKASITFHGISACGMFTFDPDGTCRSFSTDDRIAVGMDGTRQQVRWSARMGDYQLTDGIRQPKHLQAVWHYDSGDVVYFDGHGVQIEYR